MLLALETTNMIALTIAATLFIAFALIAAFVMPRRREDFPGEKGVKPFVITSLVLFVIMIGAIELFAKEEEEGHAADAPAHVEEGAESTESTPATTTAAASEFSGDAANGNQLYTSLGCAGCHQLGATAGVGPGLGGLAGSERTLADGSTVTADEAYIVESIQDPDAKIVEGYSAGIMSAAIKPGQVDDEDAADLAAFIAEQ